MKRAAGMGLSAPVVATLLAACSGPERPNEVAALAPETETPIAATPEPSPASVERAIVSADPPETAASATAATSPTPTVAAAMPTAEPSPTTEPTAEIASERSDSLAAGFIYDERYLQHDPGAWVLPGTAQTFPFSEPVLHASNYRLCQRTKQLIDVTGLSERLVHIAPRSAALEDLTVFHDAAYVERVRQICRNGGGEAGAGAPVSPESYDAALLAAGGGMAGVDAVASGAARRVFVNARPPGHHALRDKGMGFCVFNNVAVAARYAQRVYGYQRVMIVDWDVHHGNGTQDAFYDDPSVLFVSLHQDQLFPPGLGEVDQSGSGGGTGYTVNLPLPPGSGDATYLAAFDRIILPIANEFQPELVLISAGQDASAMDVLGRMAVTTEGYRMMTQRMIDLAETHASGRLVALQEGGYSEIYAPYCTLAIVETMAGTRTSIAEPLTQERMLTQPQTTGIGSDGDAALAAIRAQQAQFWTSMTG
ncbi:hypothetical protein BH24CHL1_BH24CHL1_03730 [soil metagenome]